MSIKCAAVFISLLSLGDARMRNQVGCVFKSEASHPSPATRKDLLSLMTSEKREMLAARTTDGEKGESVRMGDWCFFASLFLSPLEGVAQFVHDGVHPEDGG